MKTKLEQLLESLSNEYETKSIETEDEIEINSRDDIMRKIRSLEKELEDLAFDLEEVNLIKKRLTYWYRIADEWRE